MLHLSQPKYLLFRILVFHKDGILAMLHCRSNPKYLPFRIFQKGGILAMLHCLSKPKYFFFMIFAFFTNVEFLLCCRVFANMWGGLVMFVNGATTSDISIYGKYFSIVIQTSAYMENISPL